MVRENPEVGAIVLECTDMPPFAHLIQKAVNLPVFDLITLTNMVYNAVVRKRYQGIMPL
jgi:Asp/Glu/hydantoin racemase